MRIIQPVYVQPLILIVFIVGLSVAQAQENPFQGNSTNERIVNTDTTWNVYDDVAYKPLPVNIN